jgi:hypothetical protein
MIALDRMAAATGSRMGQLIGWISGQRPPMHLLTDTLAISEDDWLAAGGASTKANPMMHAGSRLSAMTTILDIEVCLKQSKEERTLWGAFFDPCDVPHMGAIVLSKEDGNHLALALMRRRREGPLLGEQKRIPNEVSSGLVETIVLGSLIRPETYRAPAEKWGPSAQRPIFLKIINNIAEVVAETEGFEPSIRF